MYPSLHRKKPVLKGAPNVLSLEYGWPLIKVSCSLCHAFWYVLTMEGPNPEVHRPKDQRLKLKIFIKLNRIQSNPLLFLSLECSGAGAEFYLVYNIYIVWRGGHNQTLNISSLLPRPIPRFSISHAEKRESLVSEIMCMTSQVDRRYTCTRYRQKVWCVWAGQRLAVLWVLSFLAGLRL